jgi:endonuclease/exonuclease/phosphatase family metal-dependent hydrolase
MAGGAAAMAGLVKAETSTPSQSDKQTLPEAAKNRKNRKLVRTITYNVQDCRAAQVVDDDPAVIARAKEQMPLRIALELALYDPDIITMQEAPSEKVVAEMARSLKMNYVFFPGGEEPDDNPGAILTLWDIVDSQNCPMVKGPKPKELFTRHWGRALLRTPLGEIALHSAHLWPYGEGVDGREVAEITKAMQQDKRPGRSILFQGDLNHNPESPDYKSWTAAGLIDAFAVKGTGQAMTCVGTNTREHPVPIERIDYIWAAGPLVDHLRQCRVLYERAFRTHPEDAKPFALSDHLPVMATFSEN